MLVTILSIIAGILLIAAIITLTDNFFQIEGHKAGFDSSKENLSIFPKLGDIVGEKAPAFTTKSNFHTIKKGHDLKLVGKASGDVQNIRTSRYAVKPTNFRGIVPIPRVVVNVGDEVKAGEVLFVDKINPKFQFVSPVSGEVVEIKRGNKRAISHIVILADKEDTYKTFSVPDVEKSSREELVDFLLDTGYWPLINKRPFDTIANPEVTPRDIFISCFDSSPLAPSTEEMLGDDKAAFGMGVEFLTNLTDGKVYLGLDGHDTENYPIFNNPKIETHWFKGVHPAGNVGVQIHRIKAIKSADTVWTLSPADVVALGRLISTGKLDLTRTIALTGSGMKTPKLVSIKPGASLSDLLEGNMNEGNYRVISGNVLTGTQLSKDDFADVRVNQVTTLEEGDQYELFGWLLPLTPRPSLSGTFPNRLFRDHEFDANTNTHGEKRAFVVTGQYESVLPMNIYPQHLLKAIMANDYERMEGLGIYELSEEDVALCEFACTSKIPVQKILREGLDMIEEQS